MGCNASKSASGAAVNETAVSKKAGGASTAVERKPLDIKKADMKGVPASTKSLMQSKIKANRPERLYKLLAKALDNKNKSSTRILLLVALEHCQEQPMAAKWQNPNTKSTPLHLCVRLLDQACNSKQNTKSEEQLDLEMELMLQVLDTLLAIHKAATEIPDSAGNIPLHYAIAATTHFTSKQKTEGGFSKSCWTNRAKMVTSLLEANTKVSQDYWQKSNLNFESGDATGGCSPLYRVLQTLEDDFDPRAFTVQYVKAVLHHPSIASISTDDKTMSSAGNASDGDKPLALLYRRFTRQFDISEKFFAGDNSRPEVLLHRQHYKVAAGNTWKLIELLLQPPPTASDKSSTAVAPWGLVHRAVQLETPPDLLRYIVETNAQDLTRVDSSGNIPLHYAAASVPKTRKSREEKSLHFPAFYNKYVVDELLYKFPEGASMPDAAGRYPLTLATAMESQNAKLWIGSGIQSLYEAYPQAMTQINLESHPSLANALSMDIEDADKETGPTSDESNPGIIKDEHHDAVMLVQSPDVDIGEITTSMWAHEEDGGVQMLGCVSIGSRLQKKGEKESLRIALTAVGAVVNAMKAHPNEMIIQEKACAALTGLAAADGKREISMVASGAVAAIVGAMQAHVGDESVQEQACLAIAAIVKTGGADRATVVASVSGVTAILNAIAAHSKSSAVQLAGLKALKELTELSNANLPELPKSQTEPLLLAAKGNFPRPCSGLCDLLLSRL